MNISNALFIILSIGFVLISGCSQKEFTVNQLENKPNILTKEDIKGRLKDIIKSNPKIENKFHIKVIKPDPNVEYSIVQVKPAPNVDYKIKVIVPFTNRNLDD